MVVVYSLGFYVMLRKQRPIGLPANISCKFIYGLFSTQKVKGWCNILYIQSIQNIAHGILQARKLEWVAFPFSRRSSQPRDQTQVPCIAGRQGKAKNTGVGSLSLLQKIFLTQELNGVSCIAGGFLTNWAIREALYIQSISFLIHPLSSLCNIITSHLKNKDYNQKIIYYQYINYINYQYIIYYQTFISFLDGPAF